MGRAKLSVGALAVGLVLFFAVNLLASQAKGRLDLTEGKLYTLSEGSKAIVSETDEPVRLYLYFSEALGEQAPDFKAYATRVQEILEEYEEAADGNIVLEVINPEPFSDAEDEAVQAGLAGLTAGGPDRLYFGLVGRNAADDQEVIPMFDASKEHLLEYDLTKLIYTLAHPEKKKLALLTSLPMEGAPGNPMDPRAQGSPPWQILEQMRQFFDVDILGAGVEEIPEDVDLLMVVHPKNLGENTLYAIDQFVMRGGRLLAMVDPYCEADVPPTDPNNPMAAMQADRSSSLKRLFDAWGFEMVPGKIAADRKYALQINVGGAMQPEAVDAVFYLGLQKEAFNAEDPLTSTLSSMTLGMPGILRKTPGSEVGFETLLHTSTDSMQLDQSAVQFLFGDAVKKLVTDFVPEQQELTLAARVSGKLKSAFPDGKPGAPDDSSADASEEEDDNVEPVEASADTSLTESVDEAQMVVIADCDLLQDHFWIQEQKLFGQLSLGWRKVSDNGDLILGALDNLTGSNDLISIRSRGTSTRPFERMQELQKEAQQSYLAEEQALEEKLRDTEARISDLQSQKDGESALILSEEQRLEIERFREEQLHTRKQLRDVQHNLNKDIESLTARLKFYNIALVPIGVGLLGLIVGTARTRRRHS